jgi:hypothetical protein
MKPWGSESGKLNASGELRPVARTPKPRAIVLSPGGAKERLGEAQSDENSKLRRSREGAPKAVYGRLAVTREAQSDDN